MHIPAVIAYFILWINLRHIGKIKDQRINNYELFYILVELLYASLHAIRQNETEKNEAKRSKQRLINLTTKGSAFSLDVIGWSLIRNKIFISFNMSCFFNVTKKNMSIYCSL